MAPDFKSDNKTPWHRGELQLQLSVGARDRLEAVGRRNVRDHLIEQHRLFYSELPFVVLGTVDAGGDAWATIRAGHPGFLNAPDSTHLDVVLGRDHADPAEAGMEDGQGIGLLGIELHTRRRNRMNGTIRRENPETFSIAVEQSYGNCARYIQARDYDFIRDPSGTGPGHDTSSTRLEGAAAKLIERADTFFVASYAVDNLGRNKVDVSHRGGTAGFVRLDADGRLTIPDFAGNQFFNTLGNFMLNPRAGLVFVDFDNGDVLQLTGVAEVVLDSPEIAAFRGAERLWRFCPHTIVERRDALPLRWNYSEVTNPDSDGRTNGHGQRFVPAERVVQHNGRRPNLE